MGGMREWRIIFGKESGTTGNSRGARLRQCPFCIALAHDVEVERVTLKEYLRCRRAWSKKRTQTQKQRGRRQRQSDKEKRS